MKKKFGILLSLLTIPSAAISSCFISSCSNDGPFIKPFEGTSVEFNSESNTLKLINDYYNPVQTKKRYRSCLVLDAVHKNNKSAGCLIDKWSLNLSNAPDILKDKINLEVYETGFSCGIGFEQLANILEWDEFTITVNYVTGQDYAGSGVKGSYTFNVAAQKENQNTFILDKTSTTGQENPAKTEVAWTGIYTSLGGINGQPDSPDNGIFLWNVRNFQIKHDPEGRYLYDNFFNFSETKIWTAPVNAGGVFGDTGAWLVPSKQYNLTLPLNDQLWNWNLGTEQDPNSGNIKNLIIDDYDNNPNWKEDGYKTLQIGNPYTWRSWNKMFYKCYSLLPSLHYYFDGFTNEVPVAKDGSSTGEPGTPTETYQFTPEDVDAMVYGY